MRGHTHIIFGFASVFALNAVIKYLPDNPYILAGALSAGILGGMIPDIDSEDSEIRQLTNTDDGIAGSIVSWIMPSHRGLTHEPIIPLIFIGVAIAFRRVEILYPILLSFSIGYISHILSDGLTKMGIPLFFKWRLHLLPKPLRLTTGSFIEYLLSVAVGVWLVLYGFHTLKVDWSPIVNLWSDILKHIHR